MLDSVDLRNSVAQRSAEGRALHVDVARANCEAVRKIGSNESDAAVVALGLQAQTHGLAGMQSRTREFDRSFKRACLQRSVPCRLLNGDGSFRTEFSVFEMAAYSHCRR